MSLALPRASVSISQIDPDNQQASGGAFAGDDRPAGQRLLDRRHTDSRGARAAKQTTISAPTTPGSFRASCKGEACKGIPRRELCCLRLVPRSDGMVRESRGDSPGRKRRCDPSVELLRASDYEQQSCCRVPRITWSIFSSNPETPAKKACVSGALRFRGAPPIPAD